MELPPANRVAVVLNDVADELTRAMKLHGPQRSAHESYAVILEEVDEFWDEVKKKRSEQSDANLRTELIQIAAMACRAVVDLKLDRPNAEET